MFESSHPDFARWSSELQRAYGQLSRINLQPRLATHGMPNSIWKEIFFRALSCETLDRDVVTLGLINGRAVVSVHGKFSTWYLDCVIALWERSLPLSRILERCDIWQSLLLTGITSHHGRERRSLRWAYWSNPKSCLVSLFRNWELDQTAEGYYCFRLFWAFDTIFYSKH